MPYLECPACHVKTYTAAVRFAAPEPCPNCDAPLPVRSRVEATPPDAPARPSIAEGEDAA